jgi:cell division septal protein FtsQ
MNRAEDHRRRAQRFLVLAQNISDPQRRAKAIDLAIKWMVRAREASQSAGVVVQQQQQVPENVDC